MRSLLFVGGVVFFLPYSGYSIRHRLQDRVFLFLGGLDHQTFRNPPALRLGKGDVSPQVNQVQCQYLPGNGYFSRLNIDCYGNSSRRDQRTVNRSLGLKQSFRNFCSDWDQA